MERQKELLEIGCFKQSFIPIAKLNFQFFITITVYSFERFLKFVKTKNSCKP